MAAKKTLSNLSLLPVSPVKVTIRPESGTSFGTELFLELCSPEWYYFKLTATQRTGRVNLAAIASTLYDIRRLCTWILS